MLNLAHGLSFNNLYQRDGLLSLDRAFLQALAATDSTLHQQLIAARANPDTLAAKQESELLIALAPHVDDLDRKSTRLNSSHSQQSRMPSSA